MSEHVETWRGNYELCSEFGSHLRGAHAEITQKSQSPESEPARTRGTPPGDDPSIFIGSSALLTALYETYCEHLGIVETEGPDGPYMWCACGWRSDNMLSGPPGASYAVHLTNAQHAAAVAALQPIVRRTPPTPEAEVRGE